MRTLLLCVVWLSATSLVLSQDFSTPINISNNADSMIPVVAADPIRGYVYVVARGGPSELGGSEGLWLFRRSTDGGATFSSAQLVSAYYGFEPALKVDSAGTIWMVWSEQNVIAVVKSADGGLTFTRMASPPLEDVTNAPFTARRNPDFTVDSQGKVSIVWSSLIAEDETDIFASQSLDGGEAFSFPVNISGDPGHSTNPRISTGMNDSIHVVWGTNIPLGPGNSALGPVQYARSLDGSGFEPPVTIWPADLSIQGPRIAIDASGNITVVAESNYYVRSSNNGASFTPPQQIEGFSGLHPDIAVEPDGTIDIVGQTWATLEFARSQDGGDTFSVLTFANIAGDIDMPSGGIAETGLARIAVGPTGAHVVWYDFSGEGFDSFYAQRELADPSGPFAALSTEILNFEEVPVNGNKELTMKIKNIGDAPLTFQPDPISIAGLGSGDFALDGDFTTCYASLAANATCEIVLAVTPSAEGIFNATATILSDADNAPGILSLIGSGVTPGPEIEVTPASLDFGDIVTDTDAIMTVVLHSSGSEPLHITGYGFSGADAASFQVTVESDTPCSVAPTLAATEMCTIDLIFSPAAEGTYSASLDIVSDAASSPAHVLLTARAHVPTPKLQATPARLDFGQQLVGTASGTQTLTITNAGELTLNIASLGLTGSDQDFDLSPLATVAPGTTYSLPISFTPKSLGMRTATLVIESDAPGSPHTLALSGIGTDFAFPATPEPPSATVNAGRAARFDLHIDPEGFVGDVSLACAFQGSTPRGASCSVTPGVVSLNGTDPGAFTVNVATVARAVVIPPVGDQRSPLQPYVVLLLLLVALPLLTMVGATRWVAQSGRGIASPLRWVPMAATLLIVVLWAACGGGGTPTARPQVGTPAGTYTIDLVATAGGVSKTTSLTLKVD